MAGIADTRADAIARALDRFRELPAYERLREHVLAASPAQGRVLGLGRRGANLGFPRAEGVDERGLEGRQGRGRPRSERARAAVLAAATDLLVSGQIDAVTMEAIAARSGVSKSTIYKWWPSRAHVILESFFNPARHTLAIDENASLQEVLTSQVLSLIRLFRDSEGAADGRSDGRQPGRPGHSGRAGGAVAAPAQAGLGQPAAGGDRARRTGPGDGYRRRGRPALRPRVLPAAARSRAAARRARGGSGRADA